MQQTQEMQIRSLGQEDHLKEEMATHSSILAWKILENSCMDRGAWWAICNPWGGKELNMTAGILTKISSEIQIFFFSFLRVYILQT